MLLDITNHLSGSSLGNLADFKNYKEIEAWKTVYLYTEKNFIVKKLTDYVIP